MVSADELKDEIGESEVSWDESKGIKERTKDKWYSGKAKASEKWGKFKKTKTARAGAAAGRGAAWTGKKLGRGTLAGAKGIGKAGKAAGGWLKGGQSSDGEFLKKALVLIVPLIIAGIIFFIGFKIIAYVVLFGFLIIMFLKWLYKYPRAFKMVVIPASLILIFLAYTAISGTGLFYQVKGEVVVDSGDEIESGFFSRVGEWWHCNVEAPGTCVVEEQLSEKGGVYITNLGTSMTTYYEEDTIEILGMLRGETWSAEWGAEGPDLDDVNVTVDVEWQDESYLYGPWICQQPEGPDSDFTCWYEEGVIKDPRAADMCGVNFRRLTAGAGGTMDCKADVNVNYNFSSAGFRRIIFSTEPASINWSAYSKSNIMFSTGGPVGFTIGSNRDWNVAIRPSTYNKTLPIKIYSDVGFADSLVIKPKKVILTIKQKEGLTIESDDCTLTEDNVEDVIICTKTEFTPDELNFESGAIEFKLTLSFSDTFMGGKNKETLDILGDLEYDVTTTEVVSVGVKYDMDADDVSLALADPKVDDHGCGYSTTCLNIVMRKLDICTTVSNCAAMHSKSYGDRVRCACYDEAGVIPLHLYCCNGKACALAKMSPTPQEIIDICETFDIVEAL